MSHESLETADRAVAVIGVGAVLPDASNALQFWDNVASARYSITDVPDGRWDPAMYYDPDPKVPDKTYSKIGGWVRDFVFDSLAYRIPPRVAASMDEAQMWGIVATHEALTDAGHPQRPLDRSRTAVILGNAMGGQLHYMTTFGVIAPPSLIEVMRTSSVASKLDPDVRRALEQELAAGLRKIAPEITEDTMPGELANVVAGRIANIFDLHGPNYICDAACASSLAALEAGIEGLLSRHYDVVISGGVDRNMIPSTFVKFCKVGALSPDGSRPFAKGANGFVMGEGAAVYVLKRLADAERDGDKIYAVIRGVGGASDGKGKGITAPNPEGQKRAVIRAYERAGFPLSTVTQIEAHGTSTIVGDVAEVAAINELYRGVDLPKRSVALGSIKSQIGHLKAAAGAAGLLKGVLSLHHKVLAPSAQFNEPNPNIRFEDGPFFVNTQMRPWERPAHAPRRLGVSAFGFGGTNFHVVLEEHIPGMLTQRRPQVQVPSQIGGGGTSTADMSPEPPMLRGMAVAYGSSLGEVRQNLVKLAQDASQGRVPERQLPSAEAMGAAERVMIDFGDAQELEARASKAIECVDDDRPAAWRLARGKGVFRGLEAPGKIAFLFPGQGSQYVNMLRELRDVSPTVRRVFDEADEVMRDRLDGHILTNLIFVDSQDEEQLAKAEEALRQTTVTQPAMLAANIALSTLLQDFGIAADMVMGHSLGEYAALVAAGAMPFADALIAVSARAREMANVAIADPGKMAGVIGLYEKIPPVLEKVKGYVVAANRNSHKQTVIAGGSDAVDEASEMLRDAGLRVIALNVSHAFHSNIVAPASEPLRQVIRGLGIQPPCMPVVANVDGKLYPMTSDSREAVIDRLARQIAAPVQFVDGLETLYESGVRVFVEVGPKKVLASFAEEVLSDRGDIVALATNNPKKGPEASFGAALAYLYSIGRGNPRRQNSEIPRVESRIPEVTVAAPFSGSSVFSPGNSSSMSSFQPVSEVPAMTSSQDKTLELGRIFADFLEKGMRVYQGQEPVSSQPTPSSSGSVVISGAAVGLPGRNHRLFDEVGVDRILRGEQFIESVPQPMQNRMVHKNVVRLIKSETEGPRLDLIADRSEVLQLAGRRGPFDLVEDFGIADERADIYDITTAMAIGAGIDALKDAGIPLVRRYRKTSKGSYLPEGWMIPESLADETGVVFASAFPGYNRLSELMDEYYAFQASLSRIEVLERARKNMSGADGAALDALIAEEKKKYEDSPYRFERKFLFEVLAMGHSQFAELIGARGPNTQVNSACASTTLAVATAEDWIRSGRCNRVLIIAADDVTSDSLLEWIGAGFLATGAATTEADISQAALPFDRRRNGMILGMGACALVVESEDAVRARGMRGIAEVLATDIANSAFHGTRLDVNHICSVMDRLVTTAEQRHHIDRHQIAPHTVFISHETYTPARGGSASAEVHALRTTFGPSASNIVIANTKGFTGHPMGVGIEDALAVKILERREVPPIPNFRDVDPELGTLNLSRGGSYPVDYALRFSAGFGSQIAITLYRRIAGRDERTADANRYQQWLSAMSGYPNPMLEIEKRTLRIKDQGVPKQEPQHTGWMYGHGPTLQVGVASGAVVSSTMSAPPTPEPRKQPIAPPSVPPPPSSPAPVVSGDELSEKVVGIVADKTGYPTDMLASDLDLEADLGIDTVKQAEIFAELRSVFGLSRRDDLKLRDYPTLERVIGYVRDALGVAAPASAPAAAPVMASAGATSLDSVAQKVIAIVADKTGYPTDMLALDLDLEADLGIDTVKQAEVFAELRSAFDLPRRDDLKLRDYPTLERVIGYVRQGRPDLAVPATPVSVPTDSSVSSDDETTKEVLQIVAEKTGYPTDMLEAELDLEADLGIDTVKQAEIFAVVRDRFNIPRVSELKLRDYPTLGHVVGFVRDNRKRAETNVPGMDVPKAQADSVTSSSGTARRLEPMPMVRLPLAACKPTDVKIKADQRVIVVGDKAGAATKLVESLNKKRVKVLHVDNAIASDNLVKSVVDWAGEEPLDGLFFLPGLDPQPSIDEMSLAAFQTFMDHHVRALYGICRAFYTSFDREGTFLISATGLGGTLGYGPIPAENPLAGAISGFTKAFAREKEKALVKVVDFSCAEPIDSIAQRLIEEVEKDQGALEVGYRGNDRYGITLVEQDIPPQSEWNLGTEGVVLITGAGGAITSAIAADLAKASGATFHLLDLPPAPKTDAPDLDRIASDREGLKRDIMDRLRQASTQRVTPVMVERELQRIEREAATREGIRSIERAGGKTSYHSCDVTNIESVKTIVSAILEKHGRIDLIIHAAGLERSRPLDVKDASEFDLVFDVKALGMFNLLAATRGAKLGAIVSFSSVAGRFGNAGQTDYSSANDLLCKITSNLKTIRPETQAFVIDWTAWGSIGMATRGSIPEIMKRAGIEMIDPKDGIPVVRQELQRGWRGELVVGGALGILTDKREPDGGASPVVMASGDAHIFELLVRSADPYEGIVMTTLLDPRQPYLDHHRIEGIPVMPGVMGVELFAQATLALRPGSTINSVRNVAFAAPLKCYRDESRQVMVTVRLVRATRGDMALCTLQSLQVIKGSDIVPEPKLHFSAILDVGNDTKHGSMLQPLEFTDENGSVSREDLYRAYFHGPAFQVLSTAKVASNGDGSWLVGRLHEAMPPLSQGQFDVFTAPRLLELCFQTAGVIEIGSTQKLGLPSRIDEVRIFEGADDKGSRNARVRMTKEGEGMRFDATVCDESGKQLLEVIGYHTSALPVAMDEATWKPLNAGLKGFSL